MAFLNLLNRISLRTVFHYDLSLRTDKFVYTKFPIYSLQQWYICQQYQLLFVVFCSVTFGNKGKLRLYINELNRAETKKVETVTPERTILRSPSRVFVYFYHVYKPI